MIRTALLILLAIAIGWIHSELTPIEVAWSAQPPPLGPGATNPPSPGDPASQGQIHQPTASQDGFISLSDTKLRHENPMVCFVDASSESDFRAGRIPGAFHVPVEAFASGQIPSFMDQVSRSAPVIVYCSSEACDAAILVGIRLREFGYADVVVFREGLKAWKAAGYSVQSGP